jgi:hypothetical protein
MTNFRDLSEILNPNNNPFTNQNIEGNGGPKKITLGDGQNNITIEKGNIVQLTTGGECRDKITLDFTKGKGKLFVDLTDFAPASLTMKYDNSGNMTNRIAAGDEIKFNLKEGQTIKFVTNELKDKSYLVVYENNKIVGGVKFDKNYPESILREYNIGEILDEKKIEKVSKKIDKKLLRNSAEKAGNIMVDGVTLGGNINEYKSASSCILNETQKRSDAIQK